MDWFAEFSDDFVIWLGAKWCLAGVSGLVAERVNRFRGRSDGVSYFVSCVDRGEV